MAVLTADGAPLHSIVTSALLPSNDVTRSATSRGVLSSARSVEQPHTLDRNCRRSKLISSQSRRANNQSLKQAGEQANKVTSKPANENMILTLWLVVFVSRRVHLQPGKILARAAVFLRIMLTMMVMESIMNKIKTIMTLLTDHYYYCRLICYTNGVR